MLFLVLLKCMPESTISCLFAEKMEERKGKERKRKSYYAFGVGTSYYAFQFVIPMIEAVFSDFGLGRCWVCCQ